MHIRSMPRSRAVGVLLTLTMALAMMMFSAPDASAHDGKFEHDDARFGSTCPEGTVPNGLTGTAFGRAVIGCAPSSNYVPIGNNVALCAEARGQIIFGQCTFDRAQPCSAGRVAFAYRVGNGQCLRVAYVLAAFGPNNGDGIPLVPVCIETAFAQAQNASLKVGNTFMDEGVVYLITTGAATCHFNCYNKWDINCDGKLGDFCAIEYDLTKVGDVAKCLADRGLSPIG